mmetsp:Transcript_3241/g.4731  ORF Transcript_3241/g.4731 Transcript_3241/m.4731 type:complete len:139 (-) Transcript_3241:1524-1940(-)
MIGIDQKLYCWGANADGQLAIGDYADKTTPQEVMTNVLKDGAGYKHTCAVDITFKLDCWGKSSFSQLGTGADHVGYNLPLQIELFNGLTVQVSLGMYHTYTVDEFGQLYCWGKGVYDQLGSGDNVDVGSPVMVVGMTF